MRRPGCCCSLGSRAAQVYWLAKCHTPLASAIWPKRPNTQHQTTATYKTSPHRTHRPYPKLINTQSSHLWICDIPTPSLHPTTSSTSNFKLQTSQARSGTLCRRYVSWYARHMCRASRTDRGSHGTLGTLRWATCSRSQPARPPAPRPTPLAPRPPPHRVGR